MSIRKCKITSKIIPILAKFIEKIKIQKNVLLIVTIALLAPFLMSHCYLSHLAQGQWQIQNKKKKITKILSNENIDPELQKSLRLVEEIRLFARTKLALNIKKSFRYYVELEREQIAWNVSASQADQLTAKTYWFPIVGTVPYLGFFDLARAQKHAAKLRAQGYDVVMRGVQGYSSLGWFDDPVFSTQLSLNEFDLADFIIHETLHSNLWFAGQVTINESLAEFVGHQGAIQYMQEKYGSQSAAVREVYKNIKFRKKFQELFHRYAQQLDNLYSQPRIDRKKAKTDEQTKALLLAKKAEIIAQFQQEWEKLAIQRHGREKVKKWQEEKRIIFNNAHFLSFLRYHSSDSVFRRVFSQECQKDWPCFFNKIRKKYKKSKKASLK